MNQAEKCAEQQTEQDRGHHSDMPFGQRHGEEYAQQGHHRADRKFNAAGNDDESQADTEDTESAYLSTEILQVDREQKIRIKNGHHDAENNEKYEDAEFFFHLFILRRR